jgi:hypothetical protein
MQIIPDFRPKNIGFTNFFFSPVPLFTCSTVLFILSSAQFWAIISSNLLPKKGKNMNKKSTAINLTDYAQGVKDRLAVIYSLKSAVSAGLILLDSLDPKDRENFIQIVAEDNKKTIEAALDELSALYASKGSKRRGQPTNK